MDAKLPGLVAFFAAVMTILVTVMVTWRLWHERRKQRRRTLYRNLERRLPYLLPTAPDRDLDTMPKGSLRLHCDLRLSGTRNQFRINIFEHLEHYREPGAPICTQTMIELHRDDWHPPRFEIYPRTWGNRLLNTMLQRETYTLGLDPEVAYRNLVETPDGPAFTRCLGPALFTPLRRNRTLSIECNGHLLRLWRPETLMQERDLLEGIDIGLDLAHALAETAPPPPAANGVPA